MPKKPELAAANPHLKTIRADEIASLAPSGPRAPDLPSLEALDSRTQRSTDRFASTKGQVMRAKKFYLEKALARHLELEAILRDMPESRIVEDALRMFFAKDTK